MMKRLLLSLMVILFIDDIQAQVGIGTTTPSASAQLDINSTTKGLLPPRMSDVQRNGILNPVAGLMVWCTNCGGSGEMQVYNGTNWTNMIGGPASPDTNTSVSICSQVWMVRNLNVDKYRNGDPIPKVTDPTAWVALTTGAYCYYNNDSAAYAATYGKLYNWYAVNDPRGLAPAGWHIPGDTEWETIATCLGGVSLAGGAMKETGTTHWASPNTGATNSSGFTGLPAGARSSLDGTYWFLYTYGGTYGIFWTTTMYDTNNAWTRLLNYGVSFLDRVNYSKLHGFSVRCIKD